jgi:hypothetical protein
VLYRITCSAVVFGLFASVSPCQQTPAGDLAQPDVVQKTENNKPLLRERTRILGIIPNYRTSPSLQNYEPMTSREKFKMASANAFDPGVPLLAAFSGSVGQLTNANRSFGQGGAGFGRYFGAAYGRYRDPRIHEGCRLPHFSAARPALFSTWQRKPKIEAQLCNGTGFLDPSRYGRGAVQLFGSVGELNRGGDFERLLRQQPDCCGRRV